MDATVRNSIRVINRRYFTAGQHKAVHDVFLVFVLPDDHARVVDSSENSGYGSWHVDSRELEGQCWRAGCIRSNHKYQHEPQHQDKIVLGSHLVFLRT